MPSIDLISSLIAGFSYSWLSHKIFLSHGDNSNSWKSTATKWEEVAKKWANVAKQWEETANKFEQEMVKYKRMAIDLSEERFFNPEAKLIETDKRKLN